MIQKEWESTQYYLKPEVELLKLRPFIYAIATDNVVEPYDEHIHLLNACC
ncbi:hypothetical protein [Hymenobacter sp. BT559]|nr:hypothetical protein [Hymenobacter sp. BT559]MBJ6142113.1 hypothetical protein [Hymenobacter sp. BT559]